MAYAAEGLPVISDRVLRMAASEETEGGTAVKPAPPFNLRLLIFHFQTSAEAYTKSRRGVLP
jgi:hypothetical protein